ncbi:multidrug resistance associated protein 4 [Trichuris trichiura]|uniref:Multidrug resistance associated protein 4 n=1 Tax=Trichuris trichiura TaxID=36087 RepID=A0A077ZBZ1_TRITR|nr:multidrug resistance associated protein 4 [Trichuris trichiura]
MWFCLAAKSDKRISIMNEILNAARVIKMYAWEYPFMMLVRDARAEEMQKLRRHALCQAVVIGSYYVTGRIALLGALAAYVLTNKAVTSEVVFVGAAMFNAARLTLSLYLPFAVQNYLELSVTLNRIQVSFNHSAMINFLTLKFRNFYCCRFFTIFFAKDVKDHIVSVTFSVEPGQLLAIVGPLGSGKSMILQTLLKEVVHNKGEVVVNGRIAYVPQEAWLFPGTIRQNVLFGQDMDVERYRDALHVSALMRDLVRLPKGDLTVIGDKGTTLSGGQKARINLARAVYQDADIYLLDDPLSAVDTAVGKSIFESFGYGTYEQLIATGDQFTHILQETELSYHGKVQLVSESLSDNDEENEELYDFEISPEEKHLGVSYKTYLTYLREIGHPCVLVCLLSMALLVQGFYTFCDWWLSNEEDIRKLVTMYPDNITIAEERKKRLSFFTGFDSVEHLKIWTCMIVTLLLVSVLQAIILRFSLLRSAFRLHSRMFHHVIRASIVFFDRNPIGNIVGYCLHLSFLTFSWNYYMRSARALKRLEAAVYLLLQVSVLPGAYLARVLARLVLPFKPYIRSIALHAVTESGTVGLSLFYASSLTGFLQFMLRQSTEVENMMVSVERIIEYGKLPKEAELTSANPPDESWPSHGEVVFKNVSLRYSADSPYILRNVSFTLKPGEKLGLVGRTGAGKSSVITALFRLVEPEGQIYIDNVNTSTLGLHELRKKISIIPQDPILFLGTLRQNLDPFGEHSDAEIWNALEQVRLKETVASLSNGLGACTHEGGQNFSVGQRQLICLARALLRKNRILVLDEATANVDLNTDSLIQETIRVEFKHCSVLTIAHRLNTIMDCDRVIVLHEGQLVEYDEPAILLRRSSSMFAELVSETGSENAEVLRRIAENAMASRRSSKSRTDDNGC